MIDYDWHFNYLDTKSANEQYKLSNFGTLGPIFLLGVCVEIINFIIHGSILNKVRVTGIIYS